MAITLSTKARNAACDAVCALPNEGTGPGKLRIRASSTTLVDIPLNDPAFGAAATGVATADITPALSAAATAAGVADNYQVLDSDNEVMWDGTVGESGADLNLQNTDIAVDQVV